MRLQINVRNGVNDIRAYNTFKLEDYDIKLIIYLNYKTMSSVTILS